MRLNPAVWALIAASILSSAPVSSAAALKAPAVAKNDISKGTEVIDPGSKEAEAIRVADKAKKFAPKDNNFIENFDKGKGNSFKKSEPKLSDQKIDVPDNESLTPDNKQKAAATKDDKNPVVVDDYNPNNMGVPSDRQAKAQEHTGKEAEAGSKEAGNVGGGGAGSASSEPASSKGTTLEEGTGIDPEEAAAAVKAGAAAVAGGAGPGGSTGGKTGGTADKKDTDEAKTVPVDTPKSSKFGSYFKSLSPSAFMESLTTSPAKDSDALHALVVSVSMTILSEIGDKTFLIAAILAMRHNRATIFSAAFSALAVMTIISGFIGHALPTFLSRKTSALIAGVLFLFFGINLFREGLAMEKNASVEEELEEVETEIQAKTHTDDLELGLGSDEKPSANPTIKRTVSNPRISGDGLDTVAGDASLYAPRPRRSNAGGAFKSISEGLGNLFGLILSPIWVQAFAMTFFAEWGDRSQIATVAMAAGSDYWWVIIGSVFGHFICTGSAVIGGKLLATKITLKNVTLTGALLFVIFSMVYFYEFFFN